MIATKQNEKQQLQYLAAQRQLYSTAKYIFSWYLILGGLLPVILAVAAVFYSSFKVYAVSWGVLITLADIFLLTPWQKSLKDSAAKIQEMFDCVFKAINHLDAIMVDLSAAIDDLSASLTILPPSKVTKLNTLQPMLPSNPR